MSEPAGSGPIVAGVDGSESGLEAVDWAAAEALAAGRELRVVHAFIWPLLEVPTGPAGVGPPGGGLRAEAERIVDVAVQRAKAAAPGVRVSAAMPVGAAPPVLLAEAEPACLVVVGCRGLGGFTGLMLGSTGVQLAGHAPCPVIVVRHDSDADGANAAGTGAGEVVAGVDGSAQSDDVLGFGFAEAVRLGTGIAVVHVGDGSELPEPVASAVADRLKRYPEVVVRPVLASGHPGRILVEASSGARLLVVGTRGLGGFRRLLLGSVSQAALHHSHCPVAVVPQRRETG
jgi:nucleotide-binding universal stress UspA family protein